MNMKSAGLKVISIIVLLQGLMQGIGLFIVIANYKALQNQNMILYGVGFVLSGIYVIMALRGGFLGLRRKEAGSQKTKAMVRSGEIMVISSVVIIGLNAVSMAFHVNQLVAVVIPAAFLGIAMWQD